LQKLEQEEQRPNANDSFYDWLIWNNW
jgi:hypothetical protein